MPQPAAIQAYSIDLLPNYYISFIIINILTNCSKLCEYAGFAHFLVAKNYPLKPDDISRNGKL